MLSEHARALVEEAREGADDEHLHRERLRARVLAATVASAAAAGAGAGLAASQASAGAGVVKLSLVAKLTLVALAAAAGAGALWLGSDAREAAVAPVAEARVARVVAALAPRPGDLEARAEAPPPAREPAPAPHEPSAPNAPSVAPAPLASSSARAGEPAPARPLAASASRPAPAEPASGDDVAAEAALLGRARAAHQASLDGEALKLLGEHEAKHPRGVLASERDTLKLLVECRLGRPAAKARAAALVERGSTSVFAQKLKVACGL